MCRDRPGSACVRSSRTRRSSCRDACRASRESSTRSTSSIRDRPTGRSRSRGVSARASNDASGATTSPGRATRRSRWRRSAGSSSWTPTRNSTRTRYRSPIHEFITLDQNPTGLDCRHSPIAITHHGYLKDVVEGRDKVQRNLELIRKAAEAEPDEPFHWYNMGVTAMILGDRALTISALERMFELVGEKPRGFVPVGLSTLAEAYGAEEPEKAMHAALESLKRSPHFCNVHFALGRALTRMKRYEEAREAFKAAIDDGKYNAMQFICDDEVS